MIQADAFAISKAKARLQLGQAGHNRFEHLADVRKEWERAESTAKLVELIGRQSMPPNNLPDVERLLGDLDEAERGLSERFTGFYGDLIKLVSTLPAAAGVGVDLAETLLDFRLLAEAVQAPCRVLDIGPGAGRHLAGLFLTPQSSQSLYVGLESIGLPYSLQNLAASLLHLQGRIGRFYEYLDFEFARQEFPDIASVEAGAVVHLPLWEAARLPERFFDLIICTYLLDELPAEDFQAVAGIIRRCLADEGLVYCRGSQERAMLQDLYLYGFGTYHGQDITKTLLSKGLRLGSCELIASQLTRTFVQEGSSRSGPDNPRYAALREDKPLIQALQEDFVAAQLEEIEANQRRVVVWGEAGYQFYRDLVEPKVGQVDVLGFTNRAVAGQGETQFGAPEYPPEMALSLEPDVVLIASMKDASIVRQIRETARPGEYRLVRKFNFPIAFAHRKI